MNTSNHIWKLIY